MDFKTFINEYINSVKSINKGLSGRQDYSADKLSKAMGFDKKDIVEGWKKGSKPSGDDNLRKLRKYFGWETEMSLDDIGPETLIEAIERYKSAITETKVSSTQPKQVPVYNVQAMAGNEYEADMSPITVPDTFVSATDLDIANNVDAVIYAWGQSMSPNYAPGTKLALELNEDSYFAWGEVYVIETRSNRLFKRIFPSKKGDDWISCYSDNSMCFETGSRKGELAYPPFDIPLSDILRKFDVVASQKMHKMSKIQYLRELRESSQKTS